MRIVVLKLFFGENLVVLCQILDYFNVKTVFHYEATFPRCFCVAASFVNRLKYRQIVFASALIVVFTESRSCVYDTCTVFSGNVVHACHEESLLSIRNSYKRHNLLVFHILKSCTLHFLEDFIFSCTQNLVCKTLCYIENVALVVAFKHSGLYIVDVRSYCQCHVGSKGPRCGCPCQEIFIFGANLLELHGQCVYLNHLISLSYLVGSKACSAARAVRQYFVTFVDEACIKEFL